MIICLQQHGRSLLTSRTLNIVRPGRASLRFIARDVFLTPVPSFMAAAGGYVLLPVCTS